MIFGAPTLWIKIVLKVGVFRIKKGGVMSLNQSLVAIGIEQS